MTVEARSPEQIRDDVLLTDPQEAYAHDPDAFVETAINVLLDPSRWVRLAEVLSANQEPERDRELAGLVQDGGVIALSEEDLVAVFSSRSAFEAVVAALEEVPEVELSPPVTTMSPFRPPTSETPSDALMHMPISNLYHPTMDVTPAPAWRGVALAAVACLCLGAGAVWWAVTQRNGPTDEEASAHGLESETDRSEDSLATTGTDSMESTAVEESDTSIDAETAHDVSRWTSEAERRVLQMLAPISHQAPKPSEPER